jgi:EmrB/QacA subfamily drug resistance transporter
MLRAIPRSTQIAFLVSGAFFMENLDGTVIATALPQMGLSFGTSAVDLHIGMTAYLLTLAVFIPVSGWIADRFGARNIFATAVATFTLASVLCGLSNGLTSFTAARVLQGLGGAMMVPVGRLVVLRAAEKRDLMRAIAYITWPGLAAPVIGPPLGGLLTHYFTWRWIFFLNVPLGLLGIALTLVLIPRSRTTAPVPLDLRGFLLAGASCAGLLYGLDLAGKAGADRRVIAVLLAAALAGALAIRHMRTARHPLFDFATLKFSSFAVTIWGGSLFRTAISAAPFLLPLMFQISFGLDPFQAGLLVLAVFAGNISMKIGALQIIKRFGFKNVLLVNGIFVAATLAACALLTPHTPTVLTAALLFATGLCRSMQFSALMTLGFVDMPADKMSSANSLQATVAQLNAGFGVALGALVLQAAAAMHGSAAPKLVDFHIAFLVLAAVVLVGLIDCIRLAADVGNAVSGHDTSRGSQAAE